MNIKSTSIDIAEAHFDVLEEIADVEIMITQIEHLLGISAMELNNMIDQKLDRQIERIKKRVERSQPPAGARVYRAS